MISGSGEVGSSVIECAQAIGSELEARLRVQLTEEDYAEIQSNRAMILFGIGIILRCIIPTCGSHHKTTAPTFRDARYVCSRHPYAVQARAIKRDPNKKRPQVFRFDQFHRDYRGSNENRAEGTDHIDVPTGSQDEIPAALLPLVADETYTGTTPHVLRERVYFEKSSAVVYSPIATEPASLPQSWYHELSWAPERTLKSNTIYFERFHDHSVELGRCRLCKPVTIDRTFKKMLHEGDVSHFTFAKPSRPDQVMPSDLGNILIASERSLLPEYSHRYGEGRRAWLLIPAQEPLDERIDTIETLRTTYEGGPPTAEQKAHLIEDLKEKYYRGELDVSKAGAVFVMTFENQEVKLLAEELGMTPNALSQYRAEVIHKIKNPARPDSEMDSAQVLAKLTLAQLRQINERGGIQAIRWTGGRNVQILELASQMVFRDGGEQFDGWRDYLFAPYSKPGPLHEYNVIDAICRLSREQAQYCAYVDSLPKRRCPVPGAWKTDPRAKAIANRLWSRVVVFNFGAPGWYRRYESWADEQKLAFVSSGYTPRFPTS